MRCSTSWAMEAYLVFSLPLTIHIASPMLLSDAYFLRRVLAHSIMYQFHTGLLGTIRVSRTRCTTQSAIMCYQLLGFHHKELVNGVRTHLIECMPTSIFTAHLIHCSPSGIRTRDFPVKGGWLNRLSNGPYSADGRIRTSSYHFIVTYYNGQPLFLLSPYVMEFPHYHIVSWSPAFK